jgi:dynein heavy chain
MSTKEINPHFNPDIFIKANVINFSLTNEVIENQLLMMIVSFEKPELESKRTQLISENIMTKMELNKIEKDIIIQLDENEESVLNNENLVSLLSSARLKSEELIQRETNIDIINNKIIEAKSI